MRYDRAFEIYCCWQRSGTFAAAGRELGVCTEHVRQYSRRIEWALSKHRLRGRWARERGHPNSIMPPDEIERIKARPKGMRRLARAAWLEGWMGTSDK